MDEHVPRPRTRLFFGYTLGLLCFAVGAWVRVMSGHVTNLMYDWSTLVRQREFTEVRDGVGDVAWLVTAFGLGVVLVTLHHHFQSGRAAHAARGFEPLPPRS